MAKTDYDELARSIVGQIGGAENIRSVENCITRLRFVLNDQSIADEEAIKAIPGVKGVMVRGNEYQVIIGTAVPTVMEAMQKIPGVPGEKAPGDATGGKASWFDRLMGVLSGCIVPFISPLIASGIVKGFLAVATTFGWMDKSSGIYLLLYAGSDAVFYFLPIVVGFSAGKVFGCNPYVTAMIGASLLYPSLVSAVSDPGITLFGLSIAKTSYSSTLFPTLLAAFLASFIEKGCKRVIPEMLQMIFVPAVVLVIMVPLTWLAIGPIMNTAASLISGGITFIFSVNPIIAGALLGAFWQVAVAFGFSHGALLPIATNNIATLGYDPAMAVTHMTIWALAGMCIGYTLKAKNATTRSEGISNCITCLCGVTEPTLYTIALPKMKCFVASWIGGGVGGASVGAFGCHVFAITSGGLFSIPGYINPAGIDANLFVGIIGMVAAFLVSAVVTYIVADKE